MEFSVNYSEPLVRLVEQGRVQIDRFKLPAWEHLIDAAAALLPVYVHFPLNIGCGLGDAWDTETDALVDWTRIERILHRTRTPMINLHLSPQLRHHPALSDDYHDPDSLARITEAALLDIEAVIRRWGREMILAENALPEPSAVPARSRVEFISTVVRESGVQFLFDISHARLSARALGMGEMEYLFALPLEHTAEIHITGIQRLEGELAEKLLADPPKEFDAAAFIGKDIDHQAMTEDDFQFLATVYGLIRQGRIRQPWIASMEHGGIGPFWELSLKEATLAEQLPRLYHMTHNGVAE
ncbi:MAG: DUF692 family protein [Anaerolineae bacterium]|nr:DUF692 family protein [Anaerolineae bacterium]